MSDQVMISDQRAYFLARMLRDHAELLDEQSAREHALFASGIVQRATSCRNMADELESAALAPAPASSSGAEAGVLERNPKEEIWKGHFDHSALRLELRAGLAGDESASQAYEEASQIVRDEYVKAVMRVVALTAPASAGAE